MVTLRSAGTIRGERHAILLLGVAKVSDNGAQGEPEHPGMPLFANCRGLTWTPGARNSTAISSAPWPKANSRDGRITKRRIASSSKQDGGCWTAFDLWTSVVFQALAMLWALITLEKTARCLRSQ